MERLLDGWDCERHDVYNFFKKHGINASRCNDFDFTKREEKHKRKQVKGKKKGNQRISVPKLSPDVKTKAQKSTEILMDKPYVCDLDHKAESGNLKRE